MSFSPLSEYGEWKTFKTKKSDRKTSCWIDPDGNWYNVPWSEHHRFAHHVLKDVMSMTWEEWLNYDLHKVTDTLVFDHGWIMIQESARSGIVVQGFKHMNKKQYGVLHSYFRDTPLFRGWTVKLLWYEAQKSKGDKRVKEKQK